MNLLGVGGVLKDGGKFPVDSAVLDSLQRGQSCSVAKIKTEQSEIQFFHFFLEFSADHSCNVWNGNIMQCKWSESEGETGTAACSYRINIPP